MTQPLYLCHQTPAVAQHWKQALPQRTLLPCPGSQPQQALVIIEAEADDTRLEKLPFPISPQSHAIILIISPYPNAAQGISAIEQGARGYLHALAHPKRIQQAIEALESGQAWLSYEVIAAMTRQLAKTIPNDNWKKGLSNREIEIIEQLLSGHSNKEIANILHISENTVKTHLKHLFDKFNVKDRLALVLTIQRLSRGED
jgi:DNA-binding NarL/FixJ family response regulator